MTARSLLLALLATALAAQNVRGLPDWAGPHALKGAADPPPGDPDAWVLLDLPPGSRWALAPLPDPKDGQDAFRIKVDFQLPEALEATGTEWLLPRLGLPPSPASIQRLGEPRRLPVALAGGPVWDWHATFRLRTPKAPALPAGDLETPMRTLRFTAERRGDTLDCRLRQTRREATYPHERREEGVAAQRSDWKRFQNFVDEALTVTVLPAPAAAPARTPYHPDPANPAKAKRRPTSPG